MSEIKRLLWERCMAKQTELMESAKSAMLQSQESANEQKGTMGDKFESFREQMQIDRDMHARQYDAALQGLAVLKKIDPEKKNIQVALGALVITESQKLFIAASLGQVKIGAEVYVAVSTSTPIYTGMAGKRKGDFFVFNHKKHQILELY